MTEGRRREWFFTREPMDFNECSCCGTGEGMVKIPAYTRCYRVKTTGTFAEVQHSQSNRDKNLLVVKLNGRSRMVEYEDLMPEKEFMKRRAKLFRQGVLRKKQRGSLGQSDSG